MDIKAGRYVVIEPSTEHALGIKDLDATDGAHVLAYPGDVIKSQRVRFAKRSVSRDAYPNLCVL